MGLACITISGKLGKDAVLKDVGNSQVLEFSVAVNHKARGGGEDTVNWYRCAIWGKRGEALEQYLTSGQSVVVSGNLVASEFEGKSGTKTSLDISVNEIALVGGKPKARDDDDDEDEAPARKPVKPAAKASSSSKKSRNDDDDDYWS